MGDQNDNQPFISTSEWLELRCKIENDLFYNNHVYSARSRTKTDSFLYTDYYIRDEKGQSHLLTIGFLLKYFVIVISEGKEKKKK